MPLSSRGWTLQERALAVAVLSVGRGTIRWLCPGGQYTEQGGGKLTEYHSALNQTLRAATRAPTTAAEAWREIVEDYTRRSLTYPADKLPAIAGLAAKFEAGNPTFGPSVMRHQHMVGLWRHTLLADLMWAIDREVIPTPMSHRAPSWSWAGWEGAISWSWYRAIGNSDGFSELCSIDLHKTCISDTDRAAKAVSGKLFISGLLVLVSLDSIKSSSLPIDSKETFATRSDADDFRVPCVVRDVLQGRMATRARYRREIAGSLDQDVTGPCWALRLASGKTRGSEMATAFMLLEETREICNLELRRTFRRAGMVIVKYDYCDYIEPAQKVKYKSDPGQYPLQDPIGWVGQTEYIIII
ncbi:hypothetical protein B0A48_16952 [Cryoendolithus antarcticus]|uniref:Heterokaryon incompatibility domain-containing protein n=1 Tax=Cryoendolithus antarcticus TaxID=1507870 RepID=A0A1V8SCS2_9PEZI|nr:hypothetical protein B0A48_16952 [Cryoendolithus antarcticus]